MAWQRLLAFVPTRAAAMVLFAGAFVLFWIESLGWPMAKGRDTWDYLAYYLQLLDTNPPLSELQVFRTPLTPLAVGLPLDLGGIWALELAFALLFAASIVAWSATALTFGGIPALFSAVLLLAYPAYATIYHQAASDAVFATGLALFALGLARTLEAPAGRRFALLGLGVAALVLIRPANQILLVICLVPMLVPAAWRTRLAWSTACLLAALVPLGGWAAANGIRYDDTTIARGGSAWVPFLRVFLADRTISPDNGDASRELGDLIEQEVLPKPPYVRLDIPLDVYLENGSNYETVRLIALSDRVLGRGTDYEILFESALEAIRAHPGTYVRGVANAFWTFLVQKPLREDVAPREQTAPADPPATVEVDGIELPNPQANVLVDGVPYGFVWCASSYIDSCTLEQPSLVWRDADRQRRYEEIVARVRAWDADLPRREGTAAVDEVLNRITPRFPTPPLWLLVGLAGLVLRRPRGIRTILVLWLCAFLVLLIHAASQGVTPEFALPLYPIFIVTALGALAGDRKPGGSLASSG